ncbi:hypothetical protein Fcan01_00180 [Folsomia candida]|uniref:Uncharacterized protein n=1 Tax=Folsomia candida TaxID=158441 RepID=A0A226F071_FOLCA|nr:hypothetical protein Fcan01_00180 [Folsomia candida]
MKGTSSNSGDVAPLSPRFGDLGKNCDLPPQLGPHLVHVNQHHVGTRSPETSPRRPPAYSDAKEFYQGPLASLIFNHGHKVRTLQIDFTLPNDKWLQYLESVAIEFPTLNSLKLNVSLTKEDNSNQGSSFYESNFPPKPYSFAKLKKLEISSFQEKEVKAILISMMPQLIPLFPNVVALSFMRIYDATFLNLAGTLKSLKLINVDLLTVPVQKSLTNLTRLELGHDWGGPPGSSALLKIAACTIQHVKLFPMENMERFFVLPDSFPGYTIVFPIMEKLKDIELVQNRTKTRFQTSHVTPCIDLKFEGADSFRRLDYEVQFPVLEMIKISRDLGGYYNLEGRLTEQEYFETSASFLYKSFLHESNSRGESVKYFDVALPPGDKFKLMRIEECVGKCGKRFGHCECFEWKDSTQFWDRVLAVFPNLVKYAIMEEARERVRSAEVKQWVKLGEKLGFVKTVKGEEEEARADLSLGYKVFLEVVESVKLFKK